MGGSDVRDSTLGGADVRNNRLRGADIDEGTLFNDDSLGSADVSELTGADVAVNSLGSADVEDLSGPDIVDNSLHGADISDLTGADIHEETLSIDARFDRSGAEDKCVGSRSSFTECLTTPSKFFFNTQSVLVIATGRWQGNQNVGGEDAGRCKPTRDGVDSPTPGFSEPMRSGQNGEPGAGGVGESGSRSTRNGGSPPYATRAAGWILCSADGDLHAHPPPHAR